MGTWKVVLTGNGLSVGLNTAFSLENITKQFYENLSGTQKEFIKHHIDRIDMKKYNQLDFEESIASIEQTYDSLQSYYIFLTQNIEGIRFANTEGLDIKSLEKHLISIKSIIYEYSATITDLIDGHVRKENIDRNLGNFVSWLENVTKGAQVDLFTLNYDLLLETILLDIIGKNGFMDFFAPGTKWDLIENQQRFHFNPMRSKVVGKYPSVKLHHLHGSLSSYKEIRTGRIFKIRTEELRKYEVNKKILDKDIIPSIITGGGKSLKVQQSPFDFYYRNFTRLLKDEENPCDELYIIGYSFRDEHINRAITERLKMERRNQNQKPLTLLIIDYQETEEEQKKFVDFLNSTLGLGPRMSNRFEIGDHRLIFGGANSIDSVWKSRR